MDLENRVLAVVKKYLPAMPEGEQVQVSAFLAVECWNLINETVRDLRKEDFKRRRGWDAEKQGS